MGNSTSQDDEVSKKETVRGECESMQLRYAVSEMKGLRNTMEDQHLLQIGIPVSQRAQPLEHHVLAAVFDGHGGEFTSTFLQQHFLSVFSQQPELAKYAALPATGQRSQSDVNAVVLLRTSLKRTFIQLDEQLLEIHKERTAARLQHIRNSNPRVLGDNITTTHNHDGLDYSDKQNQDGSVGTNDKPSTAAAASSIHRNFSERSGSTAVVVLLTPSFVICANAGDSRAVLRRNGQTVPLSLDHKPDCVPERLRITQAGGMVKGKRVNGDLAVSRAFGDFGYKQQRSLEHQQQPLQPPALITTTPSGARVGDTNPGNATTCITPRPGTKVIVTPDIMIYPRMPQSDEFIILACDGIWDVASNTQCTDFVQALLTEGEGDLGHVVEEILDTCLDRRSRDNMTLLLLALPAMRMDTSRVARLSNAVWGHKAARRTRKLTQETWNSTACLCTHLGGMMLGGDGDGSCLRAAAVS
jgi:serine/threonine protein phosphatase PrpC